METEDPRVLMLIEFLESGKDGIFTVTINNKNKYSNYAKGESIKLIIDLNGERLNERNIHTKREVATRERYTPRYDCGY